MTFTQAVIDSESQLGPTLRKSGYDSHDFNIDPKIEYSSGVYGLSVVFGQRLVLSFDLCFKKNRIRINIKDKKDKI